MLNEDNYKAKLVQQTIVKLGNNPIINQPPLNMNKDEKQLPRTTRATLSQLRSGYSRTLNSHIARIYSDIEDRYPDCSKAGHTQRQRIRNYTQRQRIKIYTQRQRIRIYTKRQRIRIYTQRQRIRIYKYSKFR